MSKIEEYLSKIQSAIYGKDVRQSIHDAIAKNEQRSISFNVYRMK